MLNRVILIGSCGRDPETRFFSNGDQQTTVSLATSRRWKDKQTNENKEKTSWHNLIFNRGLAKIASEYLTKGSRINVIGEIEYQEWEKDGEKKYRTVIQVHEMHMLNSRSESDSAQGNSSVSQKQKPSNSATIETNYDAFSDDIPFMDIPRLLAKHHLI